MMQDGTESHDGFRTLLLEKIDGIARKVEQTGDSVGKLVTDVAVLTERGDVDRDDIKALKGKTAVVEIKGFKGKNEAMEAVKKSVALYAEKFPKAA